jgi:hypothetical protein
MLPGERIMKKLENRASAAYDFLCALIFAAVIGAPFVIYFWSMTP